MAAREIGELSLADALAQCELLAGADPKRYERASRCALSTAVHRRAATALTEVALAAAALAELRPGKEAVRVQALERIVRR